MVPRAFLGMAATDVGDSQPTSGSVKPLREIQAAGRLGSFLVQAAGAPSGIAAGRGRRPRPGRRPDAPPYGRDITGRDQ